MNFSKLSILSTNFLIWRVLRIHLMFNLLTISVCSAYSTWNLCVLIERKAGPKFYSPHSPQCFTHKVSLRHSWYFWRIDNRHEKALNLYFLFSTGAWEKGVKSTLVMFCLCWLCHIMVLWPKLSFSGTGIKII